jgi:hypothetical protein
VIALWLGHESVDTTQIYLDASLELKEKALASTTPFKVHRGRYRPTDRVLVPKQPLIMPRHAARDPPIPG